MFKGVSGALGRTDKAEEGFYPDAPTVNFRRIIHYMVGSARNGGGNEKGGGRRRRNKRNKKSYC